MNAEVADQIALGESTFTWLQLADLASQQALTILKIEDLAKDLRDT